MEKYYNITDKFKSLYTFVIHDKSSSELSTYVNDLLSKLKSIKDTIKRKYYNDRLFSLILYLKNIKNDIKLNKIILLGQEIYDINLTNKEIKTLREYNLPNIICKNDSFFAIKYIESLLYDLNFNHVINVTNNDFKYYIINSTKYKLLETHNIKNTKLADFIDKINNKLLIHGVSIALKNLKSTKHIIIKKQLTNTEINKVFTDDEMKNNHKILQTYLDFLKIESKIKRIKFSSDIKKGIRNSLFELIFCSNKNKEKIEKLFDKSLLNFKLVIIEPIEDNDLGHEFINNYKGIIGVTYY